jgi:thymidylate synthase
MSNIDFGNPKSHIAVNTLWTDRTKLLPRLDKSKFSIIGNLYSSNGVNFLIQTLLKNTQITHLVVYGYCMTKSDEDIFNLWENGVVDGKIKGTKIAILMDPKYVDLVRNNVKLIDLRKRPIDELVGKLEELSKLQTKPYAAPVDVGFFEEEKIETIPSPLTGHHIYENSVFAAWIKLLNYVMKFGDLKMTEYGEEQKEYNNIMVTIGKHIDFLEMGFKEYYSEQELEEYFKKNLMNYITPEEMGISYTYGDRLFNFKGINQIDFIIDKLGNFPFTRRAVAVLWQPDKDQDDEHGPCLNLISCNIHNDEVYMSVVFRSNDIYGAWYKNVLGLMKLQKYIVDKINEKFQTTYAAGKFTITCISAHIYKHEFKAALEAAEKNINFINRLMIDPKGLFVVRVLQDKTLEVEYRTNEGELIQKFTGKSGEELYKNISNNDIFSFFVHSAYLGYQISKAENCMRLGLPYVQDKAPDII